MYSGDIKSFILAGKMSGGSFIQTKERLLHHIEQQMRSEGYVPHLDLNQLTTRSMDTEGNFDFTFVVYGIYVGEEKSLLVAGITDGREVMKEKSTTQTT